MACTRHALLLLPQFFMETIMKRLSLFTLCLLLAGVMAASSTYAAPQKQIVISGESRHSSPAPKQQAKSEKGKAFHDSLHEKLR